MLIYLFLKINYKKINWKIFYIHVHICLFSWEIDYSLFPGSAFGSSSVLGQGGFGAEASKVFGNAPSNLFGKSEPASNPFPNQNNAFGGSSSGGTFGFPSPTQPAGTAIYGNSSGNTAFGGQMGSCISSVFGNATNQGLGSQQINQVSAGNAFGTPGSASCPQGSAFGGSTAVFGSPAMASGSSPSAGLFGKPATTASVFGQQSVFGSGMVASGEGSVFGAGSPVGGSIFGQPLSSVAEISPSMYTPMESLSASELEQYQAQKFTLGKIPTRPPPKELCF